MLKIEYVKTADLIPYANNPRRNDAAVDKVAESIKEFGFKNPIIVDGNNEIIAGHTRLKAAEKLGIDKVPTIKAEDLTPEQAKAFRIADNKTHEFAEWDMDLLREELDGIDLFTGFDEDELKNILDDVKFGEVEEDDFDPTPPEEPTSKLGDIWQLGRHRLMCGDSTTAEDIDKLMGGHKANMVFTDPPYNVDYEGKTRDALKIINDKMDGDKFYKFLCDSFVCALDTTLEGGAIYICHADSEGLNFRAAMQESGWLMKQCLVWVKNSLVMGRQDYHWKHEPILYGWKPGAAHRWYGGRKKTTVIDDVAGVVCKKSDGGFVLSFTDGINSIDVNVPSYEIINIGDDTTTTVWREEKPQRNGEHPTMKPIGLIAKGIKNSSAAGDIVLDPFGGSGSTLIACEQLNRSCYMMELDEKYCDVIIRRWEEFAGEKAVRESE